MAWLQLDIYKSDNTITLHLVIAIKLLRFGLLNRFTIKRFLQFPVIGFQASIKKSHNLIEFDLPENVYIDQGSIMAVIGERNFDHNRHLVHSISID